MTVADNTSRNQYTATSGQTVFAYTFEIVDKDHIVVLQNGTTLSEGTDYTVSNVGNDNGGNVTLTTGATADDIITLYRDMPYSRTQNYTNSGDFLASEVNADFDELWLAGEQTDRSFSQSIRKPITDSDSISMELPDAATRADKFVKFDATGAVSVAGATTSLSADSVTIEDAGDYYDSDNVEGALQEIGAELETIPEDLESIVHINAYINPSDGSGPFSDSVALTNACNAAEVILFGGTTMDIDADWTFPVGGIARRWMFQGNTWNLTNNAQIVLDNVTDFAIVGDGATVDGNWKVARVNGATASQPTTITVDSGHNFAVDDIVSSSWSLNYLPNSVSRAAAPLGGDFNRVASTTATTITLDHQVISTTTVPTADNKLAGGTYLINAVFSKSGIEFEGTGHFHVEGVTFQNMPNAYAINVNDTTEAAKASIINCEINGIALDAINFRGDTLYMRDFKVRDIRDISKQVLVWSNQTKKGRLYGESCDWAHNNQDAFFYTNVSETDALAYAPDMVWINCVFDGFNDDDFTPRQAKQGNCLNWQSRGGASHIIAGKVEFINCNFFNVKRHILGTTYTGIEVYTQDKITFQNCNMDAEGVYVEGTGISRLTVAPIIYDNCNMRASNFRLHIGVGEVHYRNSVIQEKGATNIAYFVRGDEQEETSTTTTRVYHQGEYVINTGSGLVYEATPGSSNSFVTTIGDALTGSKFTEVARIYYVEAGSTTTSAYVRGDFVKNAATNKIYECITGGADQYEAPSGTSLGNTTHFEINEVDVPNGHFENTRIIGNFDFVSSSDTVFDNLLLPYRSGLVVPHFERIYQDNLDNKIVLEGATPTDATAIDLEDWFTNGTGITDVPSLSIKIAGTDAIGEFGADEPSSRELHFKLKSRRFDSTVGATSPLPMKGAFLVDPLENSLVFATRRPGDVQRITETHSADVNASASAGASSIVITNIASSAVPVVGDWVSLNNNGDSDVYFHEITAVSGTSPYTLTITPTLTEAITTSTNSYLIKHEYIYVHIDDNGEVPIGLTVNGDITITEGSFEVKKEDQTNGAIIDITNSFDGGGWTSGDVVGTVNFNTSDGSTSEPIRGQIKVFDDFSSSTTFPSYSAMSFSTARGNTLHERLVIDSDGNLNVAEAIKFSDGTSMNTAPSGSGGLDGFDVSSYNASTSNGIFEYNISPGNQIRHLYSLNNAVAPTSYDTGLEHQVTWTISSLQQFGFADTGGSRTTVRARAAATTASTGLVLEGETYNNSGVEIIGNLKLSSLPTSDPSETGLLWNDGGIPVFSGSTAPSGGGLAAVVDDTTPQLGGNLDLNGNDITGTGNIDVTGSVTADSATIEGGLTVSSTFPTITFTDTDSNPDYQLRSANGYFQVYDSTNTAPRLLVDNGGDISFYNSAGSSQNLFWDASTSRLGLGTTSPSAPLSVKKASTGVADTVADFGNTAVANGLQVITSDGNLEWGFNALNSRSMVFQTNQTERLRIDSSGNVGIGTDSPSYLVDAQSSGDAAIRIRSTGTGASDDSLLRMQIAGTTASNIIAFGDSVSSFSGEIRYQHSNNSLSFDTNGAEAMRIDSDGNVGIGVTSPSGRVHADGDAYTAFIADGTSGGAFKFYKNGSQHAQIFSDGSGDIVFRNNTDSERMRIDSSGNVGIGTTSVTSGFKMEVLGDVRVGDAVGDDAVEIGWSGGGSVGFVQAYDRGASAFRDLSLNNAMTIDSSGNVGIGTNSPSSALHVQDTNSIVYSEGTGGYGSFYAKGSGTNAAYLFMGNGGGEKGRMQTENDGTIVFSNTTSATERMRIDSSGNLLVGKTGTGISTAGIELNGANDILRVTRSGGEPLALNRLSSDGTIADFRKDGTTVGSIFSYNGFLGIGSPSGNDAYLLLGSDFVAPATSTGTARDGAIDLGASGRRFKDIYATNGTINTSDRNEKQDIEELSEAEQRVAVACKGLLRKFRWKSSVEEKGDDARIHFGIIAQDLQDAFTAEGLDAGRYGMFINSTWTDEETGEERSRMGVRYSELLAFIISAI
jgi:hypothetical protein